MGGFKTSYSQNNTYITCPKHWDFSYKQKLKSPVEGSSLYFGSAIDSAVMMMLENKPDWLGEFKDKWKTAFSFGNRTVIFDNDNIVYGHKDFDEHVLEARDFITMEKWAVELKLPLSPNMPLHVSTVGVFKDCASTKKNPYLKTSKEQLKYFNRCSWLSLKRKGAILLQSFHDQFLPRIERVISTQQRASLTDAATGDSVVGFIDMVVKLKDMDKPIILDLKTAARPYSAEDIELTQQLTLYAAMKGKDYNTDMVGYVVLCKEIPKETVNTCKTCAHIRTGRHQTCDNLNASGTRCGGEWDEVKKNVPEVQFLYQAKSQDQINALLADIGNIIVAMKNDIVYKNTDKCNDWYGGKCPFYNACHHNDYTGLIKK